MAKIASTLRSHAFLSERDVELFNQALLEVQNNIEAHVAEPKRLLFDYITVCFAYIHFLLLNESELTEIETDLQQGIFEVCLAYKIDPTICWEFWDSRNLFDSAVNH